MRNWFDIIEMSPVFYGNSKRPRVLVSGMAACTRLASGNPYGVTAVLNVNQRPDELQLPDITYMHVPFEDGEDIPQKQFSKCLGWLRFMYENGHVILIHCAAGISRSVVIAAAFAHYIKLMDFDSALMQIHKHRMVANPAPAVVLSAKRMLGIWPYDGSTDRVSDHEKTVADAFIWMDAHRLAHAHTDEECPMRLFLLADDPNDNRPRHEIPCTCEILRPDDLRDIQ